MERKTSEHINMIKIKSFSFSPSLCLRTEVSWNMATLLFDKKHPTRGLRFSLQFRLWLQLPMLQCQQLWGFVEDEHPEQMRHICWLFSSHLYFSFSKYQRKLSHTHVGVAEVINFVLSSPSPLSLPFPGGESYS